MHSHWVYSTQLLLLYMVRFNFFRFGVMMIVIIVVLSLISPAWIYTLMCPFLLCRSINHLLWNRKRYWIHEKCEGLKIILRRELGDCSTIQNSEHNLRKTKSSYQIWSKLKTSYIDFNQHLWKIPFTLTASNFFFCRLFICLLLLAFSSIRDLCIYSWSLHFNFFILRKRLNNVTLRIKSLKYHAHPAMTALGT